MRLIDEQRALAALLGGDRPGDPRAAAVHDAVAGWARVQLRGVCPLSAALLTIDGRYAEEVDRQRRAPGRPASVHRWGELFLRRLADDADPVVARLAALELLLQGRSVEVPHPWVWPAAPTDTVHAVLSGQDPRSLPRSPTVVDPRRPGR